MFSSYIFGSFALSFRIINYSSYLPYYYISMKTKILQNNNNINNDEIILPNLSILFSILSFSLFSMLYGYYIETTTIFIFLTYFYVSILYLIYLNIYFFSEKKSHYMLIVTLLICFPIYLLYKIKNIILIEFLGFIFLFLSNISNIIKFRNVFSQFFSEYLYLINNDKDIYSSLYQDFFVDFFWIIYSSINNFYYFVVINLICLLITLLGIISYMYSNDLINKNNFIIKVVKKILLIKNINLIVYNDVNDFINDKNFNNI